MAVFLTLFLFITLICFAAVLVIAFTRCMTIALTNRQVYDDLRRLGASNSYLYHSVHDQVKRVFLVPAVTGTAVIYAFYTLILYANDGRVTANEVMGMLVCIGMGAALSALLYGAYRVTLGKVCGALEIRRDRG